MGDANKKQVVLIAGPTASGKSDLALAIAARFPSVIINADSCQVYEELQILSARPSDHELAQAPHALYGHRTGAEPYSTGLWLGEVEKEIRGAVEGGRHAVIVGGTGLYFKALCEGLSPVPDISNEVRGYWRKEAKEKTAAQLHELLSAKDAAMAMELEPNDKQRVLRALEVMDETGRSLKVWQEGQSRPLIDAEGAVKFVVGMPRDDLYQRIDERLHRMVGAGALDEVHGLLEKQIERDMPIMKALGVPEFIDHLAGGKPLDEAVSAAQQQTRRYAKRQLTWLRRNMITWNDINSQEMERKLPEIFAKIDKIG